MSGLCLNKSESSIVFMQTDLPDPVVPAINKWGIVDKSTTSALPAIFFPKQMGSLNFEF